MVGTFWERGASSGVPMLNCSCKVCTSSYSKNKRLRSSFFLESSSGIKLLIDTGPDIRQQLLREKIDKLDLVFTRMNIMIILWVLMILSSIHELLL